jgi:hypothetical protein
MSIDGRQAVFKLVLNSFHTKLYIFTTFQNDYIKHMCSILILIMNFIIWINFSKNILGTLNIESYIMVELDETVHRNVFEQDSCLKSFVGFTATNHYYVL